MAVAADQDIVVYWSEHKYSPGATAAAGAGADGICTLYLQQKFGILVSSSKYSLFHLPPKVSFEAPLPIYPSAASSKVTPMQAASELRCGRPAESPL